MAKKKQFDNELCSNRKARHTYQILETFEAGIVLKGTEIKSLRNGGGSLAESYIKIVKNTPVLIGAHIAPYSFGNLHNHDERRDRTLLLHKKEIEKLLKLTEQKGFTIVPLAMYLKKGYAKVSMGVAKGKQLHDKRQALKERDSKRAIDRALKGS